MLRRLLPLLLAGFVPAPLFAAEEAARVTVPLDEWERVKRLDERPALTVVDTLRFTGSFKKRDLAVAFSGRAVGRMPALPVLSGPVGLHGCEGDALLSRGDSGEWLLTPLAARFTLTCRLAAVGSDRLELSAAAGVLWIESEVADGAFVAADVPQGGPRAFSIVRVTPSESAETVRPTATARYRVTLHPEETRFRYELEVRNPNRAHQPFDVLLSAGERVAQVDSRATYEVEAGRYRFDVPPGEAAIALSGTLAGNAFAPPVDASLQYLLLEAHPLLRPVVPGAARRISPAETGMSAQFRGAQAFLLGVREPLTWTVTRLEALRTTSFAVRSAQHRFFIDVEGTAMGETELSLDNQGASDIELPMKAEPTFASLADDAVLLTRNAQGNLWLPLSMGPQTLLVQHRQGLHRVWGLAWGRLVLPDLAVPATRAGVELRYPAQWTPIWQSYAPESRAVAPSAGDSLFALLLLVWLERLLAALGFGGRRRVAVAALLAAGSLLSGWLSGLLLAACLGGTGLWIWAAVRARRAAAWKVALAVVALGVGGLASLAALLGSRAALNKSESLASASYSRAIDNAVPAQTFSKATAAAPAGPTYQGLPAKFEMPWGARRETFSREMLKTDADRPVRVILVSQAGATLIEGLVLLLGALLLLAQRGRLREGLRELTAPPPAPPQEPPASARAA